MHHSCRHLFSGVERGACITLRHSFSGVEWGPHITIVVITLVPPSLLLPTLPPTPHPHTLAPPFPAPAVQEILRLVQSMMDGPPAPTYTPAASTTSPTSTPAASTPTAAHEAASPGTPPQAEPQPPDLLPHAMSLLPPVVWDAVPPGRSFGEPVSGPRLVSGARLDCYRPGQVVEVTFRAGNPRNDLKTGSSFFTVERWVGAEAGAGDAAAAAGAGAGGSWLPVHDDNDWCT